MAIGPIRSGAEVTPEVAGRLFTAMVTRGVCHLVVDEGKGPRRMVFASLFSPETDEPREVMVAMEGSGCVFLTEDSNINQFVFIQNGFQITAAQIAATVIGGLASARAALLERHDQRAQLQIEAKRD